VQLEALEHINHPIVHGKLVTQHLLIYTTGLQPLHLPGDDASTKCYTDLLLLKTVIRRQQAPLQHCNDGPLLLRLDAHHMVFKW